MIDGMTEEEQRQAREDTALSELASDPRWGVYKERLLRKLAAAFERFLTEDPDRLVEHQGYAKALWDTLGEVEHGKTRIEELEAVVRHRHETAIAEERAARQLEAEQAMRRQARRGVPAL